jgi:hypothetical protein
MKNNKIRKIKIFLKHKIKRIKINYITNKMMRLCLNIKSDNYAVRKFKRNDKKN